MEYNFLPLWYKIRQNNRRTIFLKIMLIAIIIANLIIVINLVTAINTFKQEEIVNKTTITRTNLKKAAPVNDRNITCLNTFEKFNEFIGDKVICKKINVTENKVDLVLEIWDLNEYEGIIKFIEANKNIKILKLGPAALVDNNKYNFTTSLEWNMP